MIHHNPDCGTSRNVLAIIEASGEAPLVIEYLKTGWTRPQLQGLFAAADLTPRTALRTTKSPAEELGLLGPPADEEALLAAMLEHPVLVTDYLLNRYSERKESAVELLKRVNQKNHLIILDPRSSVAKGIHNGCASRSLANRAHTFCYNVLECKQDPYTEQSI